MAQRACQKRRQFVRNECIGECEGRDVVLAPEAGQTLSVLRDYSNCKSRSPASTSAVILVPERDHAQCTPLLASMFCMGKHKIPEQKPSFVWVYRDDPRTDPGVVDTTTLPQAMQLLLAAPMDQPRSSLAFVFSCKVAGLNSTCLWDSGATKSFVSSEFVARHGLAVLPVEHEISLADGSRKQTAGMVKTKLRIQQHHSNVALHVTDLVAGFDVILGNDWSTKHRVLADFSPDEGIKPHLYLRNGGHKLHPHAPCGSELRPRSATKTALVPEMLTAIQAQRALKRRPPRGAAAPFLVNVRECRQASELDSAQRSEKSGELFNDVELGNAQRPEKSGELPQTDEPGDAQRPEKLGESPPSCEPTGAQRSEKSGEPSNPDESSDTQRSEKLGELLKGFETVFAEPQFGSARNHVTECIALEEGAQAPNRPPFRQSLPERREVEKRVAELLANGGIQPSNSPFGAPVLFVPKPDGTLRMCIDYRALNKVTKRNKYPLPRIDDLMDNLAGATCFSALDLSSGYHQFKLVNSDVPKTAFNTHIGKYEWKVLPMGITNAPAVFQAAMHKLFGPYLNRFVCIYLDDVLIFSRSEAEHFEHLRIVLDLLRRVDLRCKLRKCEFFKKELKFLGHIVSAAGIKPDPGKVAVVQDWPVPQTVFEVRSFLGLANYFRKYIRSFAATASPLTDLLKGISKQEKKGKLIRWGRLPKEEADRMRATFLEQWTPQCQRAFDDLKRALVTAPVLKLPDFSKPFELVSDGCEIPPAVGAVLLQEERPVAYYSRKLSGAELRYSATDIEMVAVIAALREWRCYLEGRQFTIVTDHQPNTYLDVATSVHTLKRRARWLDESSGFDYVWRYRPGRMNVADPISRAPQHFACLCGVVSSQCAAGTAHAAAACTECRCQRCTVCQLRSSPRLVARTQCEGNPAGDAQEHGVARAPLRESTRKRGRSGSKGGSDNPKTRPESRTEDSDSSMSLDGQPLPVNNDQDVEAVLKDLEKKFVQRVKAGYRCCDSTLSAELRKAGTKRDLQGLYWTDKAQLLVPDHDGLREECIESVHSNVLSGHFGTNRTYKKAQEVYFWPKMRDTVETYVRSCDSCQRVKAMRQKPQGKLHPLEIPGRRWESVSMDLITDLPVTQKGYDAIVVFVDRLSKMVHVAPCCKTVTAEQLAEIFEHEVFKHHGIPEAIVSDRDVRFQADFWKAVFGKLGTKLCMSTAKHAQTDGQTERANQVLEDTMRHFVGPYQTNWDEFLSIAEFAMNNAWNSSVRNTPFMLNYGQHPNTPAIQRVRNQNPAVNKFIGKWSDQMAHAKRCLVAAQQRQKTQADKHRQAAPEFQPGDQVLVQTKHFRLVKGLKAKLAPRFIGPFKVLDNIGPANLAYRLELPQGLKRMHPVLPVSSLKRYHQDGNYQPPPLPDIIDGEEVYDVDWIADTRYSGARRQYKVYWLGWPDDFTWENWKSLQCPEKLKAFWAYRKEECPHPILSGD